MDRRKSSSPAHSTLDFRVQKLFFFRFLLALYCYFHTSRHRTFGDSELEREKVSLILWRAVSTVYLIEGIKIYERCELLFAYTAEKKEKIMK